MRQDFIKYIKSEKRYSIHTITSYQTDLEQFQAFCKSNFNLDHLNQADHFIVRSWLVSLLEQGISASSVNRKISCLKSFYKFLLRQQKISASPMVKVISPKAGRKLPEYVKEQEMDHLLNEIDFGKDFEGIRNKFIIETFYLTGIRISELINIKIEDVNMKMGVVKIFGKRNKERFAPLPQHLRNTFTEYSPLREGILSETGSNSPYLFISKNGKQTYPKLVYRIINKYLAYVSTNTKKSPHTLRHSFATIMLNRGAELNSIKEILGHANLSATQVYTHNSMEKIKSIYKQAHPRA